MSTTTADFNKREHPSLKDSKDDHSDIPLPDELLTFIFSKYLTPKDMTAVSTVNRRWNAASRDGHTIRSVISNSINLGLSSDALQPGQVVLHDFHLLTLRSLLSPETTRELCIDVIPSKEEGPANSLSHPVMEKIKDLLNHSQPRGYSIGICVQSQEEKMKYEQLAGKLMKSLNKEHGDGNGWHQYLDYAIISIILPKS